MNGWTDGWMKGGMGGWRDGYGDGDEEFVQRNVICITGLICCIFI